MINKTRALALTASFVVAIGLGGFAAAQDSGQDSEVVTSARFCKVYKIENPHPAPAGICQAPGYTNDAGSCVTYSEVSNAFSYIVQDDKSLDFGLSYWFGQGAHCGIIGNAKPTETGWRYENDMDAADPRRSCAFDITIEDDMLVFDADPAASCRMECGAHAQMRGIIMPFCALEGGNNVTASALDPEVVFNTPCRQ